MGLPVALQFGQILETFIARVGGILRWTDLCVTRKWT